MRARIDAESSPAGQDRIQGLDELRGIAVLWVVLLHSWGSFSPTGQLELFIHGIISAGWLGVDLFFALSGFLITRILMSSRERPDYFRVFYWRRSLRIFPLYFAVLAIAFASEPQRWEWLPWYALYGVNFYTGELPATIGGWTFSHFWSLCVEEHFYLLWPFVIRWVRREHLLRVIGGVAVGSLLVRLGMTEAFLSGEFISRNSFCRFDSIALGSAIVVLPWSAAAYRKIFCVATIILLPLLVLLDPLMPLMIVWGKFLIAVWASAAVGCVARGGCRRLSSSILAEVGGISYGVYVWHFLLMGSLNHALGPMQREMGYFRGGAMAFTLVLGFGLLMARISWRWIEKPFLALR